jgi:hypothetical protein
VAKNVHLSARELSKRQIEVKKFGQSWISLGLTGQSGAQAVGWSSIGLRPAEQATLEKTPRFAGYNSPDSPVRPR